MPEGKYWKDEDVKYLEDNYSTSSIKELCEKLGRSENAVKDKAFLLKLKKKEQK